MTDAPRLPPGSFPPEKFRMETNHHGIDNGNSHGGHSSAQVNGRGQVRARVLDIDEALPYMPFSSVIPFNSDIVPMPSFGLRSAPIFATPSEQEAGRQGLESFNRELQQNPNNTSQRLQKALHDLRELLKPEGITHYDFKVAPKISSSTGPNVEMSLSPFAKLVLDRTNVNFTYPSPSKPTPPVPRINEQPKQRQTSKSTLHPHPSAINPVTHAKNNSFEVQIPAAKSRITTPASSQTSRPRQDSSFTIEIPGLPKAFPREQYTPSKAPIEPKAPIAELSRPRVHLQPTQEHNQVQHRSTPQPTHLQPSLNQEPHPSLQPSSPSETKPPPLSSQSSTLAVIIPDLPSTFNPVEYQALPESPDSPPQFSRKRARSEGEDYDDDFSRGVDQREKADKSFQILREYLQDLFEAEEQVDPENLSKNTLFIATSEGVSLTLGAHNKVDTLLQNIISLGRFLQAPLDDLLHLQRLCEGAMKESENINVKVDETMGETEVEPWLQRIALAELGIRAARTSLRLMTGGRDDKQLYSEDVIQSALNAFKNVTENCIIPIVEMRSSGPTADVFKLLSSEKKSIIGIMAQCRRLFTLMANLVGSIELSETVINTLEFTASKLIFVENAHFERDSILGISKFDNFRVVAMDVLAEIFLCHPAQRLGIFDEILTSLEKLPVTKQSARQFKLAEGGSIQLVSALIMRLIQTSASKEDDAKEKRRAKALEALNDGEGDEATQVVKNTGSRITITSESRAEQQAVTAIQELRETFSPLTDNASQNASYVVRFIVGRAQNSTKSGDTPYRNLLDLFVDDFITCLNSPDWPAAELLLRIFLIQMVKLAEGEKTPAPDKNMALDLLGSMGAAISELTSKVRKTAASLEMEDSDLGRYLLRMAENSLEKKASGPDIVSWSCGPFRTTLEFLQARSSSEHQLATAIGFFEAEWASKICTTFDLITDEKDRDGKLEREYGRLAYRLRMMISDKRWLTTEYSFDTVSPAHARLAYSLTVLNSQFCGYFSRVLMILLGSMQSEQATVRSKSLKSVNQVLDTDPTIIDREPAVMLLIGRCANDQSIQVRDSALQLIGKCISLRPALEEDMLVSVLQRINDSGVGVRKRAMKLAKDIYLRNSKRDIRSVIADSLLHRVTDLDDGVKELARQTIEEIWMMPFYERSSTDVSSAQYKLAVAEHVSLMVKTVQRGSGVATVLDKVLQNVLSKDAKYSAANLKVCKILVATMFETIIDNSASSGNDATSAREALQILQIFAKSDAKLFTPDQIKLLLPYISNVNDSDDLAVYRSVVIIFRHVLPNLQTVHHSFLVDVRKELTTSGLKMSKIILDDVVACLWIISEVLQNYAHLTQIVSKTLGNIQKAQKIGSNADGKTVRILCKWLQIVGMCGKHCNLDPQEQQFRKDFPAWKSNSVSKLMCDMFAPFANPSHILEIRTAALDAIGMVCQSWPKNFESKNIYTVFIEVFQDQNTPLETIIMKAFKEFLLLEEKRSEAGHDGLPGTGSDPTGTLSVMGGGQGDGVAPALARRYLEHLTRIALTRQDDQALLAVEVLASIARQGLLHPKEVATPLIALETSKNPKISEIAFREHRALHEKHETVLEKEYMRSVQLAYEYQRDVVNNCHGATLNPYTSKLHLMIEVLKVSKPKNRKRFYDQLCARIEFDPAKMDLKDLPHHLEFSQFVIENMAFFEYATIDELLSAINAMEKVVATTGTGVAHSIETEIFKEGLNQLTQPTDIDENGQAVVVQSPVDPLRLKELTAASMMLSSLWEARTHLRRLYGLMNNKREAKSKAVPKDLNKAPVKVPFANGDKFWEETCSTMAALESEESMMAQCKAFVQLLNIDQDFKLVAEGDEEAERVRMNTPSDNEEASAAGTPGPPGGSGRGRKRKAGNATPGGRKKARGESRGRGLPKGSGKRASVDSRSDNGSADGY